MNKFVGWFITMNLVNIFWVFFRATNLHDAIKVIKGMFDINGLIYLLKNPTRVLELTKELRNLTIQFNTFGNKEPIIILFLAIFIVFVLKNTFEKEKKFIGRNREILEIGIYFVMGIISLNQISIFLYFNF